MKSEEEDTIQLRVNQGKFIPLDEFQEIRRKASLVFGNVFGIPDRLAYFGREREPDEIKDKDRPCLITADPKIKKNTCLILVAPGSRKNNERRPFIRIKVNKYDEDVRTFFLLNLQ